MRLLISFVILRQCAWILNTAINKSLDIVGSFRDKFTYFPWIRKLMLCLLLHVVSKCFYQVPAMHVFQAIKKKTTPTITVTPPSGRPVARNFPGRKNYIQRPGSQEIFLSDVFDKFMKITVFFSNWAYMSWNVDIKWNFELQIEREINL